MSICANSLLHWILREKSKFPFFTVEFLVPSVVSVNRENNLF